MHQSVRTPSFVIRNTPCGDWYLMDLNVNDGFQQTIWTARLNKALLFTTEEGVEDFKHMFFQERPYEIVRIA